MRYKSKKWNARDTLDLWIKRNLIVPESEFGRTGKLYRLQHHYKESDHIPIEQWEITLKQAAVLVERLGEEFLPIFERAERELGLAKENIKTMQRIKNIAGTTRTNSTNLESDLF